MKKMIFAALVVYVISLLSVNAHGQKFSQVVTDTERWDAIRFETPAECTGSAGECSVKLLDELNVEVGQNPEFSVYELGEKEEKAVTVVFVSHFLKDDDYVLGRLYRLELSHGRRGENSYKLEHLGRMSQCMNGPAGWRKTPCPM